MRARLIDRRQRTGAALLAGLTALLAVGIVLLDEGLLGRAVIRSMGTHTARTLFAVLLAVPLISPLLVRAQKARRADARLDELGHNEVRGLSLARADRGWSLAIEQHDGAVWFVELESLSDARRLVRRLRAGRASVDGVSIPGDSRVVPPFHWVFGLASLLSALLYYGKHNGASIAVASFFAFTSAVMTVVRLTYAKRHRRDRPDPRERSVFDKRTAWGRHAWLHLASDIEDLADVAKGNETARVFARGDESTRAWLSRIDELAAPTGGAYRDGLDEGALRAVATDEDAPLDERMAAARLLKKRVGASIAADVEDEDVRARIAAATSEEEDAAERIDDLGPIFRISRS